MHPMRRSAFSPRWVLLVALGIGCAAHDRPAAASARLRYRAASDLPDIIKHGAFESRLSIEGVAFRDSTLYVATNVGLVEVQGARATRIAQWLDEDNVMSGPWYDENTDGIWVQRQHDGVLLYRRDSIWRRVNLPKPPNGEYYTRGDMLEGFRGLGDSAAFRLVGAGAVWRRAGDSAWVVDQRPPTDATKNTVGFGTRGRDTVAFVTDGGCGYMSCTNEAIWRRADGWQKPLRLPIGSIADVVSTSSGIFVRSGKGELLRVDPDSAIVLETPGVCEAVTRSSAGQLIASFRGAGVFALDAGWRKLFDDPSDPPTGEQWAFLAEHHGKIAFATTTVPKLKPGSSDRFYESGDVGLWVGHDTRLVRVPLSE